MLKKLTFLIFLVSISTSIGFAYSSKPDSAKKILSQSLKLAEQSNKKVLIIFHATWCKWCKHLDEALESPELKKIIDNNFVVAHIDVQEQEEKKDKFENPGGEDIMINMNGGDAGLPFYVFLNSKGKKIVDSKAMPENQNIGYPGSKAEIKAFTNLLKKSSPRMTKSQLLAVKKYLEKNSPQ